MLCEDSSTMASALIGHTGTVGGSLLDATSFTDLYNSANVAALAGRGYDLMVCSGAPASKWKANQDPAADLANLQALMTALNEVSVEQFILISTVDVFARPVQVDEASPVRSMDVDPYGRHRHGNALHLTHRDSIFQFYDLSQLWRDLQIVLREAIPVIHFATGPVNAKDVAQRCFGITFDHETEKPAVYYDMRTRYSSLFHSSGDYLYEAEETLDRISRFVVEQRERSV